MELNGKFSDTLEMLEMEYQPDKSGNYYTRIGSLNKNEEVVVEIFEEVFYIHNDRQPISKAMVKLIWAIQEDYQHYLRKRTEMSKD
jgi:hypothetical protein